MRGILSIVAFLLMVSLLWLWASKETPSIFVEHGPMENCQALCLAIGILIFAGQTRSRGPVAGRLLVGSLALFYATFLLVEFDTRELGWRWADHILHGTVRNAALVLCWAVAIFLAWRHRVAVVRLGRQWILKPPGLLLLASGAFWLSAGLVDKLELFPTHNQNLLAEELLETNAGLLMLFSAVASLRHRNKTEPATSFATPEHPLPESRPGQTGR